MDRGADHRALGARPGARQDRGARRRSRRLHRQAVRRRRAARPAPRVAPARRAHRPRGGRARLFRGRPRGQPGRAPGPRRREGDPPHADRVPAPRHDGQARGQGPDPPPAPARGLGPALRGPGALPPRLHGAAPPQDRGRSRPTAASPHRARASATGSPPTDRSACDGALGARLVGAAGPSAPRPEGRRLVAPRPAWAP